MSDETNDITKPITLRQLAATAIGERFDLEFENVLDNALDPNRPDDKVRKIVMTVSLAPNEADAEVGVPRGASMSIDVKAVLAPLKPLASNVHFGRDAKTGKAVAVRVDPQQHSLFKSDEPSGVVPISKASERGGESS